VGVVLEQIGQKLKAARESQGLSLAQINERTKISINHLQAIDSGIADDLPETVYVAGFIKRYAECVGLNGPSLSDEYRASASESNGQNGDGGWGNRGHKAAKGAPTMVSPAYVQKMRTEQRPPNLLRTVVFPAMWIVALIPIVTFLFQWQQNNSNNNSQDLSSLSNFQNRKFDQVLPTATPNGPTQTGPTTTTTAPPATSEAQVSISASRHVWVEIKAVSSGESLFTGNLEAGDQREFKDPQGIRVHSANGALLTVVQDGKTQTLGPAGKPAEKAFMAKNASAAAITAATTADGKPVTTAAAIKPPVKKVVKKTATADASAVPKRRFRSIDEGSGRQLYGESMNGTRSIDVPYRYTEGRLDQE